MDFQSVNPLNVRINLISGNLFPMTTDNTRFPVVWKIYSAFVWFVISVIVIGYFFGLVNVSKRKAISDGMIGTVFIVEVFFMVARIHMRKNLVLQLIQNMNEILRVQDETMRRTVIKSLKLMHSPFKFYWLSGAVTAIIWIIVPVGTVFKRNFFFYEDYRLPFAISKQPFSTEIFLIGNLLLVFCSVYVLIKKAAVDIYMLNFVMLMTAQYQYISLKLKEVLRKEYSPNKLDETKRTNYSEIDFERKMEIKRICRHHSTVIRMSAMLKELLSLSFSLIYVNNILRFSFVGVMLLNTALLKTVIERIAMVCFACGELIQFFILCFNVQKLLDASREITDRGFHENWYQSRPTIKHTFMLLMLSNKLTCKLASFENFSISLPSFMTVMNQAYSIALLCLKIVKK